jgi:hypothetical protein
MPGTSVYDTNPGVDAGDPYINSFWVSATNHPAIYGRSSVANGVTGEATGAQGIGVHGISTNNIGSFGETKKVDNNYGFYTPDNLYSFNIHLAGAIMQVVQNGGSLPIEPGDVVVFSGLGEPLQNGNLNIQVQLATSANSTAVAGVAYSRFNIAAVDGSFKATGPEGGVSQETTLSGPAAPGDYLLMVVQGPAQVKVSALDGGINPGDLLATGSTNGIAGQAAEVEIDGVSMTMPGVVFAKALEALESGEQLIYAYVILK